MSSRSSRGFAEVVHHQLLLVGLLPSLLLLLCFTGYFIHGERVAAQQAQGYKAARLAHRLASQVSSGIEHWQSDALRDWLAKQPERRDVSRMEIYDLDGRTVAVWPLDANADVTIRQGVSIDEPVLTFMTEPGKTLIGHPRVSGRVRVVLSSGYLSQRFRESLESVSVLFVVALSGLVWLGWYLVAFHIRPLRRLDVRIRQLVGDNGLKLPAETVSGDLNTRLEYLVTHLISQHEGVTRQKESLMLMLSRFERLHRKSDEKLTAVVAQLDAEQWARHFLLAQMESELRPCLLKLDLAERQGSLEQGHLAGDSGLAVLDNLLANWHQNEPKTGLRMCLFDPRRCLEQLMGVLMAGMPHISLILLVSPDFPSRARGDPVYLNRILIRWISQLGRVMHQGELTIRVRYSVRGGEPGWYILIHAPLSELVPAVRNDMAFLWGSTSGPVPTVASVITTMEGQYGTVSGVVAGTFYYLHLPFDPAGKQDMNFDRLASWSSPLVNKGDGRLSGEAVFGDDRNFEPSLMDGIFICVIDGIPLSRKAWVWQLQSMGVAVIAKETIDDMAVDMNGNDAPVKIVVMSVPDSLPHGCRQELFVAACSEVKAWPVLILPFGDFEGRDYYTKAGAVCLTQPVSRDDWCGLFRLVRQQNGTQEGRLPDPDKRRLSLIRRPGKEQAILYGEALLSATRNNKKLAYKLLGKLLDELPGDIQAIDGALRSGQIYRARDITHKVNGAARFCGFVLIGKTATDLETVLIDSIESEASPDYAMTLTALKVEIERLLAVGQSVLASLS